MSTRVDDASADGSAPVEEPVPVRFSKVKGVFKVPFEIIMCVLFLHAALFAGLRETKNRKIEVNFETNADAAKGYFAIKWHLLKKTKTDPSSEWDPQLLDDVLALAHFFQDEEIHEIFNERATAYLDKHFSKDCVCGFNDYQKYPAPYRQYLFSSIVRIESRYTVVEQSTYHTGYYMDENLTRFAIIKQRQPCTCYKAFWERMNSFITEDALFAQWIWESISKDTLLQYISAPKKRVNTLFKTDFNKLTEYIDRCSEKKFERTKVDPKLQKMYDEMDQSMMLFSNVSQDELYILQSKIKCYEEAKRRALNRHSRTETQVSQVRVNTLVRMAQKGAFS
jgi:hypothetical protein